MAIDILMPALSPTMEQGKLAKWLKKEGDPVKPGDVLAEIETDKATMEVEAVDEGVLAKILVSDGTDNVAVNTPIAILAGEGEDVSAAAAKAPNSGGSLEPNEYALQMLRFPFRQVFGDPKDLEGKKFYGLDQFKVTVPLSDWKTTLMAKVNP